MNKTFYSMTTKEKSYEKPIRMWTFLSQGERNEGEKALVY